MSTGHSETYAPSPDNRHSLPLILTFLLFVFFFLGFFSIYFCRYLANVSWLHHQSSNTRGAQALPSSSSPHSAGLHPCIIASFPIFSYALVKDHRRGKCGLECAVCLSEFSDDDVLRLLTVCNHAFHRDCIDLWFASHITCPVCRQNLDPADESTEKTPEVRVLMPESDVSNDTTEGGEVVMVAREESEHRSMNSFKEEEEGRRYEEEGCSDADVAFERGEKGHVVKVDWLQRSHSTGHSLLEEDDRYTLRLPENVKERITRERNCTKSCCIVFGDVSDSAATVAEERSNVSPS